MKPAYCLFIGCLLFSEVLAEKAVEENPNSILVRVIDQSTLEPIAGARIFLQSVSRPEGGGWGSGRNRLHIATDGIWSYEPKRPEPPGSRLTFQAEAEGYRPDRATIVCAPDAKELTIALAKAPRITGRILNPDGTPANGARFRVFDDMGPRLGPVFETIREKNLGVVLTLADEWGRFSLAPQREMDDDFIAASESGVARGTLDDLEKNDGTITLQPYAEIEGAIFIDDKPADKFPLTLFSSFIEPGWLRLSKRPGVERFDSTSESFQFKFLKNWPWGEAEVILGNNNRFSYRFRPIPGEPCYLRYDLPSNWENLPPETKIEPRSVPLLLRITLPDGTPVTTPELHFCWKPDFDSTPAHTYKDGQLRYSIPSGGDILRVSYDDKNGHRWFSEPKLLNFSGNEPGELEIELKSSLSISGKLEFPSETEDSGNGIVIAVVKNAGLEPWRTGAWKSASPGNGREGNAAPVGADWTAMTNVFEDGTFALNNLPSGDVALYAWADDHVWAPGDRPAGWNGDPLLLGVIDQDRDKVVIPMIRKVPRTVQISDSQGNPVENFQLTLNSSSSGWTSSMTNDGFPIGALDSNRITGLNGFGRSLSFFRVGRFYISGDAGTDESGKLTTIPIPYGVLIPEGYYANRNVSSSHLGGPVTIAPGQEEIELRFPDPGAFLPRGSVPSF